MPDILIKDEGTLVLLTPVSSEGEHWLTDNLDPDCQHWGSAFVVEHRYVGPIIEGARAEGLSFTAGG